jgi:hypothetical protein
MSGSAGGDCEKFIAAAFAGLLVAVALQYRERVVALGSNN